MWLAVSNRLITINDNPTETQANNSTVLRIESLIDWCKSVKITYHMFDYNQEHYFHMLPDVIALRDR